MLRKSYIVISRTKNKDSGVTLFIVLLHVSENCYKANALYFFLILPKLASLSVISPVSAYKLNVWRTLWSVSAIRKCYCLHRHFLLDKYTNGLL